jgi:hypothetical protein
MDLNRFSRAHFDGTTEGDLVPLCRTLAEALSHDLAGSQDWDAATLGVVEALRSIGHDLWSLDDNGDAQLWCGDWTRPQPGGELRLRLVRPQEVEVIWRRHKTDEAPVAVLVRGDDE